MSSIHGNANVLEGTMDLQNIKFKRGALSEFRVENITNPIHEKQTQL